MYLWGVVYQSSTPNDGSYKYITDNLIQKYMESVSYTHLRAHET